MNKDWKCSGCNYHNFGKNMTCRKCHNLYSKEQETNQCINQTKINSKIPRPPRFNSNDGIVSSVHTEIGRIIPHAKDATARNKQPHVIQNIITLNIPI